MYKVLRSASKVGGVNIERIELVQHDERILLIHQRTDGFDTTFSDSRVWKEYSEREEAHRDFNRYLSVGYTERKKSD